MAKLILIAALFAGMLLFSSCNVRSYKDPQPLDASAMTSIPKYLRGDYKVLGEDSGAIFVNANGFKFLGREKGKFPKELFFKENGRSYVIVDNSKKEVFDVEFFGDSLSCKYESSFRYTLDSNMVVKKLKEVLVFNLRSDYAKDTTWYPFILTEADNVYVLYYVDDDVLKRFENKTAQSIANRLKSEDVSYFLRNKDLYLEKFAVLDKDNHSFKFIESGKETSQVEF